MDVHRPAFERGSSDKRISSRFDQEAFQILLEVTRKSKVRGQAVSLAFPAKNKCLIGIAESRGRLDQRIEHALQVKRRAADHLEHVGVAVCCCSDSRSSFSSRVFSMAMTA